MADDVSQSGAIQQGIADALNVGEDYVRQDGFRRKSAPLDQLMRALSIFSRNRARFGIGFNSDFSRSTLGNENPWGDDQR